LPDDEIAHLLPESKKRRDAECHLFNEGLYDDAEKKPLAIRK